MYYLMSMPMAQIELMCIDTSITVYPKVNSKGTNGRKHDFEVPSKASMDRAKEYFATHDFNNTFVDVSALKFVANKQQ